MMWVEDTRSDSDDSEENGWRVEGEGEVVENKITTITTDSASNIKLACYCWNGGG